MAEGALDDPTVSVRIKGLGKQYHLGQNQPSYGRLTESLTDAFSSALGRFRGNPRSTHETRRIWALRHVDLDVRQGEVVGIVGRNGAGKTTLLKLLSRITEPSEGSAEIFGRVGSLLEVGTGFHPELSGRENIFLNGALLGMRRAEILKKLDEIVAFAEVDEFLDTPVKRYSSGMQVRLAFAVAAHLEPEILIVDEVLAVGDLAFQRRCLGKMDEVSRSGRTVLFVSHNLAAVEGLCSVAYLLERGQVVAGGAVSDVLDRYTRLVGGISSEPLAKRRDRQGSGRLRFTELTSRLVSGKSGSISLTYHGTTPLDNVAVSIGVFTLRGEGSAFFGTEVAGKTLSGLPASGTITCELEKVALLPGIYTVNVHCVVNGTLADWIIDAAQVDVGAGDFFGTGKLPPPGYGFVMMPHEWRVD